ncbi:hypothetical protein BDV41DRAFT_31770 [Aspergillus transmontanensis]|uniref:Uncharacterized protein n=1 Tax=Aspergillus transmontanensis TaxID=1034304 RepID=A0A5N6VHB0_9EURO|nr:hypothetical protein BDV41DRAFT_31770 [Aspergillus transmontanensis]
MAVYLSVPIINELVRLVDISTSEDSVHAMGSAILNYYFPVANGYAVIPGEHRGDKNITEFNIIRIERRFPGDRSVVEHTTVKATQSADWLISSPEQLEGALWSTLRECGRCWVIIILGPTFRFYEYHLHRPTNKRVIPWGPPNQQQQNSFHVRHDCITIDWMLRHMAQNDAPPVR